MGFVLIDDLDPKVFGPEVEWRHFSFDGTDYRIALGPKSFETMTAALKRFIDKGEVRVPETVKASGPSRTDLEAVRTWARANGHDVKDRGRISADVLKAYDARNDTPSQPTPETAADSTTGEGAKPSRRSRASAGK